MGIAGQAEVVLQADLGGIFHLRYGASERFAERRLGPPAGFIAQRHLADAQPRFTRHAEQVVATAVGVGKIVLGLRQMVFLRGLLADDEAAADAVVDFRK